jgi:hypothetical protein
MTASDSDPSGVPEEFSASLVCGGIGVRFS